LTATVTQRNTGGMPRSPARPYRRGKYWWIKYYANGVPVYESSGSEKYDVAAKLLKKRQGEAETGKAVYGRVLVGSLLDDLLQFYRVHRPRSLKDFAEPFVKRLRKHFGDLPSHRITTLRLRDYQERRKREKAANATVNREMALLRRAFNLAAKATPPRVTVIPQFEMLPENNTRQGFLGPEAYEKLKQELLPELVPLLVVGYHVGCRRGELVPLKVEQVDLDAKQIRLYAGTTKNDEGRLLPIYGDMEAVLSAQLDELAKRWPRCRYLFHRCGQPIKVFRESWDRACERAGVPGLLFHDLRRSAVRNMVRAGVPEAVAMRISGHKTRAIFDRYNIVSDDDIADAGKKVGEFLKARKQRANKRRK
jgi:integrase